MRRYRCLAAFLLVLPAICEADTVLNNTVSPVGTFHILAPAAAATSQERGNTVTLGGTARVLTSATPMFRIGGAGVGMYTMSLRLYRNDGPAGAPGGLLWESPPRTCLIDSGASVGCMISIPGGVVVPDSFTWTVQVTGRSGFNQSALGPGHFTPPAVGSIAPGVWVRDGAQWTLTSQAEPAFGIRFDAVACRADFNGVGGVSIQDVFDFLAAYFAQSQAADFNRSGGVSVQDIFDFLAEWFVPCG